MGGLGGGIALIILFIIMPILEFLIDKIWKNK
jgi:hypothetical protein